MNSNEARQTGVGRFPRLFCLFPLRHPVPRGTANPTNPGRGFAAVVSFGFAENNPVYGDAVPQTSRQTKSEKRSLPSMARLGTMEFRNPQCPSYVSRPAGCQTCVHGATSQMETSGSHPLSVRENRQPPTGPSSEGEGRTGLPQSKMHCPRAQAGHPQSAAPWCPGG